MKKSKTQNQLVLIIPLLLAALFTCMVVNAQKAQNGNGQVTTKRIPVDQFWDVELQTYCNVTIKGGEMPMVEFTIDENLREFIDIEVVAGTLYIKTEEWIKASEIQLSIQVPFIKSFKNAGWGDIDISNIKTEKFELVARTGTVRLSGEVDQLTIEGGPGEIDAMNLISKNVTVERAGYGKLIVNASERLEIKGEYATVQYLGMPEIIIEEGSDELRAVEYNKDVAIPKVKYVSLKIRNNTGKKKDFFIRGPKEQQFSYGFPMQAYFIRKEKVPIGTKIWEQNGVSRKLLIEITANDEGKTIDLFNKKDKS